MANYPTSDPSFPTRTAGQTIASAHINAVQDEVVAIGSALRGTLAHGLSVSTGGLTVSTGSVNLGGPSSLATLQVNGGSTFAAPVVLSAAATLQVNALSTFAQEVTFSSNVTIGGSLTVTGGFGARVPSAIVTHDANQVIPGTDAWTGLSWNTEVLDSTAMHSTAVNSSRIALTSSGLWAVGWTGQWSTNSTGQQYSRIALNDATGICADVRSPSAAVGNVITLAGVHYATSTTDYVTVQGKQNSGTNQNILATSTGYGARFWAHRVSV
jgi:hypothetical protein